MNDILNKIESILVKTLRLKDNSVYPMQVINPIDVEFIFEEAEDGQ